MPASRDCRFPCFGSRRQALHAAVAFALPTWHAGAAQAFDFGRLATVAGNGPAITDHRELARFHGLQLRTDARVVIRQGDRHAIDVKAQANIAPLIDARIDDGILVVSDQQAYRAAGAEVVITVRSLTSLRTSGSSEVSADGLSTPLLALGLSGSSSVRLSGISVGKLSATLGGSSDLRLSGSANELVMQLGGSSNVRAGALAADRVTINGGGSADVLVWARESLSVALGGSCDVRYYGVANATIATGGAATVRRLGASPP